MHHLKSEPSIRHNCQNYTDTTSRCHRFFWNML